MAVFIKFSTGAYPIYEHQIKQENPLTSFGPVITNVAAIPLGYMVVNETVRPDGDVVEEGQPTLGDDGEYYQTWSSRDFTEEELEASLETKKAELLRQVEALTSSALAAGASFDFSETDTPNIGKVAMRDGDRVNVIGLKQAAERELANSTNGQIYIRCVGGDIKAMSPQKCIDMSWAVYGAFTAVMAASWGLQGQIKAASSIAALPTLPDTL